MGSHDSTWQVAVNATNDEAGNTWQLSSESRVSRMAWGVGVKDYIRICATRSGNGTVGCSVSGVTLSPLSPLAGQEHHRSVGGGQDESKEPFGWRQGGGVSNLPVADPTGVDPRFHSRWVVDLLWLRGLFVLFQVCFPGLNTE